MARQHHKTKAKRTRGLGFRKRLIVALSLLVAILVLAGLVFGAIDGMINGKGRNDAPVVVSIPSGAGLGTVSSILSENGLIESETVFKMRAYQRGIQSDWQLGRFEIPAFASLDEIQDILTQSTPLQTRITFPEGLTSWQMVQRLKDNPDLEGDITAIPPEGSLAPNTYNYEPGDSRQGILDQMQGEQERMLAEIWAGRDEGLPIASPEELLTLASIIEKETGNAEERAVVASVFINRLNQGMKLQTDPTVIYGITNGEGTLGRGLRRSELDAPTPYNTYVIEGLPPGPIANPGRASLEAAAHPADTDYVFFVAKTLNPADGHVFAVTYEEHQANVANYRALEAAAQ